MHHTESPSVSVEIVYNDADRDRGRAATMNPIRANFPQPSNRQITPTRRGT